MNAVSLFAGVGGFDLALRRAGVPVVATVEIDKQARSVLERHFPTATHFTDITEVTGEQLRAAGGHLIAHALTANYDASEDGTGRGAPIVPFVKVIRSGARDENGDLPPEVWAERKTAPTLNQFDQSGESRTPVLLTMREGKPGGGKGPLISEDQSLTLATGNGQTLIHDGVRRLTPTECERLQGFPDDWTAGQADSARYKQMGNAVAVPVVEWIARRLAAVVKGENDGR